MLKNILNILFILISIFIIVILFFEIKSEVSNRKLINDMIGKYNEAASVNDTAECFIISQEISQIFLFKGDDENYKKWVKINEQFPKNMKCPF